MIVWVEDFALAGSVTALQQRYPVYAQAGAVGFDRGPFFGAAFGRGLLDAAGNTASWRTPSLGLRRGRTVGQWFRAAETQLATYLLRLINGTATQLELLVNEEAGGDWSLSLMRGSFQLGRSRVLARDEWVFVELDADVHPLEGSFELRLNGDTEFAGEDENTADEGIESSDRVEWAIDVNGASATSVMQFAHVYVTDDQTPGVTGFLGPVVTQVLPVELIGARDEFTRSTGTDSIALIDDAPAADGDTTYLRELVNARAILTQPRRLRHSTRRIHAITAAVDARVEVASTFRRLATLVRQGGVEALGPTVDLNATAYATKLAVLEENPLTSRAWTLEDLAGAGRAELGLETSP